MAAIDWVPQAIWKHSALLGVEIEGVVGSHGWLRAVSDGWRISLPACLLACLPVWLAG